LKKFSPGWSVAQKVASMFSRALISNYSIIQLLIDSNLRIFFN
jgi:hypothetical protein